MTKRKYCIVCHKTVGEDNRYDYSRIYDVYLICTECQLEWFKAYWVLTRTTKYSHLKGLENWKKIFDEWRKSIVKEKVVFT